MNKWCMLSLESTGLLGDWLNSRPANLPGNSMDNKNVMLVITPPVHVLDSVGTVVNLPIEATADQLVAIIGKTLSSSDDTVILGYPCQFESAYQRWEWWAWCSPYVYKTDDDPDFIKLVEDNGLPSGITRAQARELIKNMINSGGSQNG